MDAQVQEWQTALQGLFNLIEKRDEVDAELKELSEARPALHAGTYTVQAYFQFVQAALDNAAASEELSAQSRALSDEISRVAYACEQQGIPSNVRFEVEGGWVQLAERGSWMHKIGRS